MIPLALLGESILIALAILGLAFFFMWRLARAGGHEEGLLSLPGKLLLTAGLLGVLGYLLYQSRGGNRGAAFVALFMVLLVSFPLVIMWLPHLIGAVLSPFFGSLTGGGEEVEARPMYFRAIGLRKRGDYAAALAAAEAELARFPDDVEGLALIADIRATDLHDPSAALAVLEAAVSDPGRTPDAVALLLSRLADLQLNRLHDTDAARASLGRIVAEFPGTEAATLAAQRLAHLPGERELAERAERPRIAVPHHEKRLGLEATSVESVDSQEAALRRAGDLVRHLGEFPDDWERREELAQAYGDMGRPELGTAELEQLLRHPDAQPRHVARWLNLLADLQLRAVDGVPAARETLDRLIAWLPETPWAEQAAARQRMLSLGVRGREPARILKLGTYEQNIGLKRGDPGIPDPGKECRPE